MNFFQKQRVANAGNPKGFWGRQTLKEMNKDHAPLLEWGLSHIVVGKESVCLDIGCGGGQTLKSLSEKTNGKLYGLDISDVSVQMSKETNKEEVESGRMKITEGNVLDMPYKEDMFDVVTAVETFYFWEKKQECVINVHHVLKEDGVFVIMLDAYDDGTDRWKEIVKITDLELNTPDYIVHILEIAGFKKVTYDIESGRLCVIAVK